jgi:hypothetical protein
MEAWLTEQRRGVAIKEPATPGRAKMALNGTLLAFFLIFVVARLGYVVGNQSRVEAKEFPAAAAAFISSHALPGPMLNHYNWGGYFIWKLYPQYRVFIDGRADMYGDSFMDEYAATYAVKGENWREPLSRWEIRTIVVPPESPLLAAVRALPAWKQVYSDTQVTILSRD